MPSSTSSSSRGPLGLLCGIALFTVSEAAVWNSDVWARLVLRHQPTSASGDTLGVSARIELMEKSNRPRLLLLGSSQVREGLDCSVLEPATGVACANLGLGGGSPLDMLHVVRELNPRGPDILVVAIFPGVLHKPPKSGFIDTETISLIVGSGALHELTPADRRLLGLGLLQSLSPTLRHRDALRDGFREMADTWPDSLAENRLEKFRRTSDSDRKPPVYFANRIGKVDPDVAVSRFTAVQDRALDRLIGLARDQGSAVVVVNFPVRPGYETTLSADVRSHFSTRLGRLRDRADIRVVDSEELGPLTEGEFIDFTHVDSSGRRLLSERLGALIARGPLPGHATLPTPQ